MGTLYQTHLVKFECSCGQWSPLSCQYFCRSCVKQKCEYCVTDQVDITFCPTCLENVPPGDAKNRRHLCQTCYVCPICDSNLVTNVDDDLYHLRCATCRWTTRDAELPDQAKSTNWPQHENGYEEMLTQSLEQLKVHSSRAKLEKDKMKYTHKRRSNLGTLNVDRYNLQSFYQTRRKLLMEPVQPMVASMEPTADVPELDESIFTTIPSDKKTLGQMLTQLFSGEKPLYPCRTKLAGKRLVRCSDCEYSPTSIRSKIQMLAHEFTPEIRLSRAVKLTSNQASFVFFSITNVTLTPAQIKLTPEDVEDDKSIVTCDHEAIEFTLQMKDDVAAANAAMRTPEEEMTGCFVFKNRHRYGLRLGVVAKPENQENDNFLILKMEYWNKGIATDLEKQNEWLSTRVKLCLGPAIASTA
ncbi:hypothetical protein L596_025583 [Steinernema carpocapsae]|uniref:Dynactin subunit 4 n=1 Tax=Steinernema carpocapsae TaxID=34508 RepID=A0A4U5M907_STECR|nr:hypothetical protein L596_025583 [Steinernema carpocapsae]